MAKHKLTDVYLRNLKPREKNYVINDGQNLQILVKANGSLLWEIRYRFEGKRRKSSIGTYPTVSLKRAREIRDNWFEKLADDIDPILKRRSRIEEVKVEQNGQIHLILEEWIPTITSLSPDGKKRLFRAFERDVLPYWCKYDKNKEIVSSKHIKEISSVDIIEVIGNKYKSAAESAYRLYNKMKDLWEFAIAKEYCDEFIFYKIPRKMFIKTTSKHYSKITDEEILKELLQKVDKYNNKIVRAAIFFVALVPLRSENLCKLQWGQIDFKNKKMTIPREKMKIKNPQLGDFILPLSTQAIEVLEEIKPFTGWGKWVFTAPTNDKKHLSNETIRKSLRNMGYDGESGQKQTLHSFRGTFRSLCDTYHHEHNASFETKERVLDHHERSLVVRAYSHQANFYKQMKDLLQWWGDFLENLKK